MNLSMVGPIHYQIQVQGTLDPRWSGHLGGMAISASTQEDGSAITTLTGILTDQAALLGVLNALYNLHLPLMSVQCLLD
jgi:hypothetical protein